MSKVAVLSGTVAGNLPSAGNEGQGDRLVILETKYDGLKDQLSMQSAANDRLEIILACFGILVTIIIIYFAFKTEKSAIQAATTAAKDELLISRNEIDEILKSARLAEEKMSNALLEIEGHKQVAASDVRTIRANRDQVVQLPKTNGKDRE
ncbi:hypothetical protein [Sphingomonas sp. Leaf242]|uniref:hypothetical protein n=1 Tax=Sphingomonas sp. Leaf242 TaxID=1736304 RepID=UPI0012E12234|nr:hypothetical protein [Sphingomonas sp. Leaf242]